MKRFLFLPPLLLLVTGCNQGLKFQAEKGAALPAPPVLP